MEQKLEAWFKNLSQQADHISLRYVKETTESLVIRQGKFESAPIRNDEGIMVTVEHQGGIGYASTSNLSESGVENAISQAKGWASNTASLNLKELTQSEPRAPEGTYHTPTENSWNELPFDSKLEYLHQAASQLKLDSKIVDWQAGVAETKTHQVFLTSNGGKVEQKLGRVKNIDIVILDPPRNGVSKQVIN